ARSLNKNAGDAKTVSLTSTSAGTDAGNYLITGQASTTADITRANLSVGGITASGKVYDGNVDATLNVSGKTLTGLIAGDDVSVSATGAFSDKNAGDAKTVSLTSTSAGTDAGNYLITGQASTTADITRANLSVGGITASGKVYDGNVDAALDVSGKTLTGLIAGDTVTVSTTGAFSNKNAGDAKTVSLTSASADA
ncbi:YDG domain-containing protein, partial [Glaciecola punicea]|uniref:YDG domain-containing protein n=1 Tax=Glaciecola punicea TaxID=56804 RepID=UPI000ACE3498